MTRLSLFFLGLAVKIALASMSLAFARCEAWAAEGGPESVPDRRVPDSSVQAKAHRCVGGCS